MKKLSTRIYGRTLAITIGVVCLATVLGALTSNLVPGLAQLAGAAVANYPTGVQVAAMPIHMTGPYTVNGTVITRFKIPYAARLIGFSAAAETVSGTITVDFKKTGVSVLSGTVALSTATVANGTIATSTITDEAELTAVVGISGASATVSDITILPTFVRR